MHAAPQGAVVVHLPQTITESDSSWALSPQSRLRRARAADMTIHEMRLLANDALLTVRTRLAVNDTIPEEIQWAMVNDSNVSVLISLTKNRSVTERVLQELSNSSAPRVREAVARKKLTPLMTLQKMAKYDPSRLVQIAAKETLAKL